MHIPDSRDDPQLFNAPHLYPPCEPPSLFSLPLLARLASPSPGSAFRFCSQYNLLLQLTTQHSHGSEPLQPVGCRKIDVLWDKREHEHDELESQVSGALC
ncbi:hypothetical protein B0T13DRAFT_473385 [Neurospora crassa]|nr:hypothetical protein B0T13DRAFT_473385 [Neurospora crassa]